MNIQLAYTPNDLLVWIRSLIKKFFVWVAWGRERYLIIIVSLIALYFLYIRLFKFLTSKFSKEDEKD